MSDPKEIDWKGLQFTCVHEESPPFDPEADAWYREARNLQKTDEDRYLKEIVELYRRAIAKGHYNAMHRLALLYMDGAEGFTPDEGKAVDLVEQIMEMNVASGYYQMGVMLEQGIGVKQDREASLSYMRRSADMGSPQGQLVIGKKMLEAFGAQDEPERSKGLGIGEKVLECAFGQGLSEAGYELGFHYLVGEDNIQNGLNHFQKAAALGHNMSLYMLHSLFNEGRHGVKKDAMRAACYERLGKESDADPQKQFPNIDRICPLPPKPMPSSLR